MRISIAQLNYHIGNFARNKELILSAIRKAKSQGSDLIVFSELCISGYPPLDLLERSDFIEKCNRTVDEISKECKGITAIVGAPTFNRNKEGKKLYNSALVLSEGNIVFTANKTLLPTYDIFDEYRYFEPENHFSVFNFRGNKIAITICEDLWDEQPFENDFEKKRLYTVSPLEELIKKDPHMIINISASPFSYSRITVKTDIFRAKARKYKIPVITSNQTGANTELIFDGASMIIDKNGDICRQLPYFEEAIETFTTEEVFSEIVTRQEAENETIELIHMALVMGLKDYFTKSGLKKCVIGLSGGIDSAVCACLAVESLGNSNVNVLMLPSRYSSEHSVNDAIALAEKLNISYEIVNIEKPFRAFEDVLMPVFKGRSADVTEENIQARIRAVILMAVSNKFGYLLLNTSNKSEAAVGYGTLYGDMAGGLSVIGDVYKTDIYRLAGHINRNEEIIPLNILRKRPSAELRPDQYDTDSLPDYKILDQILHQYIELQRPPEKIFGEDLTAEIVNSVIKMINTNEFKRYQAPPVLRVSSKSFGDGRKMPLVARY